MRRLVMILGVVLSFTLQADETQHDDNARRGPMTIPSHAEIENLYFSLVDLSLEDQRVQLWAFSSGTKAALWTYNAERYLRNHPELGPEGQELLRRGVALINTPAWFDIQEGSTGYAAKRNALTELKRDFETVLAADVIREVLIRLGPEPPSASSMRVQTLPGADSGRFAIQPDGPFHCSCGSYYDCTAGAPYNCFDAWCIPTPSHCGFYGDDPCWGRCKSTE